jgi:Fur family transcriptional regulator, ferric uptake regulator
VPVTQIKDLEAILNRLNERKMRVTKNRERVIGALLTAEKPLKAEEIKERGNLDLVTVYRNIEAFEKAGVLQRIPLENGAQLFELTAPDEHYHHLICRECHQAERLDLCVGEEMRKVATANGYSHIAHVLEVYGVCSECVDEED